MVKLIKQNSIQIYPIIIKPKCYELGLIQDCRNCKIKYKKDEKRST